MSGDQKLARSTSPRSSHHDHMRSDTSQHAVYLSFNFAAAVCIVLINKAVFSRINFGFSTTLTLAHYVLNIAGLEALRLCGAFELRPLPLNTSTAVLTVVVGAAPAINNLALKLNDVGFYTTCKLLVTPCIVVLELALFSKRVSLVRALCLAGVCAGVGAASVSDFSLNLPGLLASLGWARLAAALAARVTRVTSATRPWHVTGPDRRSVQSALVARGQGRGGRRAVAHAGADASGAAVVDARHWGDGAARRPSGAAAVRAGTPRRRTRQAWSRPQPARAPPL